MIGPMFILVGPSASGKTTFANRLAEELGLRRAVTTTTRQPRPGEGPDAYHCLTPTEFQEVKMVECISYAGNKYGTSCAEADMSSLAILEPVGAQMLQNYCQQKGRPCFIIGLSVSTEEQVKRMMRRGDSPCSIENRLQEDRRVFRVMPAICNTLIMNNEFTAAYAAVKAYIVAQVSSTREESLHE